MLEGTPLRERILVVRNPVAGGGRRGKTERCLSSLREQGCRLDVLETRGAGDAADFVQSQNLDDYDAVVAAGGDGTVREVAEALIGSSTPLALIPTGTANVLAKELGLPGKAADLATFIRTARAAPVTLGLYESTSGSGHFVLMAGAGFDARVVAGVNRRLKHRVGKVAYLWRAIQDLPRCPGRRLRLRIDGAEHEAAWAVVSNVSSYAGNFIVAPDADIVGDSFQVCLYDRGDKRGILAFGLALGRGGIADLTGYRVQEGSVVEFLGPEGDPLQVDGDPGGVFPMRISPVRNAIKLVVGSRSRDCIGPVT
jgi:diacylglycerol kinase family enzyme